MHWATHYIGKPWESGAQGPEAYDCWGLVRAINLAQYDRQLPAVIVDATDKQVVLDAFFEHEEFEHWQLVESPKEGDCVITKSAPGVPDHIGVYIDVSNGRVLQSVYGSGVVALSVEATRRFIGQHIEFWRWAG